LRNSVSAAHTSAQIDTMITAYTSLLEHDPAAEAQSG
jgi:hypothetical protein